MTLAGDARLRACALSADAYHVTAGFLLKTGDQGLAHLAADRSMSAALASQDPLTVGASARIVTHALMNSGQLMAAISTARNHSLRLDREIKEQTPEFLSVYGSVLLRGAIAAAQHDERGTAHEMLAEPAGAARRLGTDANLRGTASARSMPSCTRSMSRLPSGTPGPLSTWPAGSTSPRSPSPNGKPAS